MGTLWQNNLEFDFCNKLHQYIENNPCRCDVTFTVGPDEEPIKSLRAVLEVSSPQFRDLLDHTWSPDYGKDKEEDDEDEEGEPKKPRGIIIPLPDTDPKAFRIFLRLLLTQDISIEGLRTFDWTADDVLNLISLSRRFGMTKLQQNLDILAKLTFMSNISNFIRSEGFMSLSQRNLEVILANDEITMDEVDIFKTACSWSEFQCSKEGLEKTDENIRTKLGDVVHQIRFPIMAFKDFGKIARAGNLLRADEQLEIFKFISLEENEVDTYDKSSINFITAKRSQTFGSNISFLKDYKAVDEPSFVCDGAKHTHYFQVDTRVSLNSVSFLGPIESDSFYEIDMEIIRYNADYTTVVCGRIQKKIFTRKHQLFYIMFDEPIVIDVTFTRTKEAWKEYYGIRYSIVGPNTQVMYVSKDDNTFRNRFRLSAEGVNFHFQWCNNPIAEFFFQKC